MAVPKTMPPLAGEVVRIGACLREAGGRPVLVGGWVRDFLLGRTTSVDFDLEVFGLPPKRLRQLLGKFGPVHAVGRQFGVLKLTTPEAAYDVSVPRRESKTGKGHKGFWVDADPGMTYPEAASRRDFTINSMGYAFLEGVLLDPFGGVAHLEAGLLRHVGPAFGEDPLRVLRAMQLAGRLEMEIAPETLAICRRQELAELPRERLWEEFKKLLLQAAAPSQGLRWAGPLGILPYFPELAALAEAPGQAGRPGAWQAALAVVDAAAALRTGEPAPDTVLMFASLCGSLPATPAGAPADGAARGAALEPGARALLARLTNEARVVEGVVTLLRECFQPEAIHAGRKEAQAAAAQIRWLATRAPVREVVQLARARFNGAAIAAGGARPPFEAGDWLLEQAQRLGVGEGAPEPILTGHHLKELGLQEGKALGRVLKEAFARQLAGDITTLQQALAWAREALAREAGTGEGGGRHSGGRHKGGKGP